MILKNNTIKRTLILGASVLVLTACNGGGGESPEKVMEKFQAAVEEIYAADAKVTVSMKGTDDQGDVDFKLVADFQFDRPDKGDRKADIDLEVTGALKAGEQTLDGDLDLKLRTIGDEFYFKLGKLESSDPSVENFMPLIEPFKGKWMHLSKDFIPESLRELQEKDPAALEKEEQFKKLFAESNLFEIDKEFGVETVNGKKTYHYSVRLNKEGLKEYVRKSAALKDYYLYKAIVELSGAETVSAVDSTISLSYEAKSYNKKLNISVPADAEEFNPLAMMLGGQIPDPAMLEGLEGLEEVK
jgi:hypothetical protein